MDHKRDGPFEIGDRVEKRGGGEATVIEVDGGQRYPNFLRHDSGSENWWPDDELTLISPAIKLEAQKEDIKVGDRFEDKKDLGRVTFRIGWVATVVDVRNGSCSLVWAEADGTTHPSDSWPRTAIARQLVKVTTEPVAAQKETNMKAYRWVIWSVNDDGGRMGIVNQSEEAMPFKNADNAKLWAWQQFAKTGEDPDNYEVEAHPFGG